MDGVTDLGEVTPEQPAPTPGVTEVGDVNPPGWGDVLSSAIKQPGLQFIEAGGGALRAIGDLIHSDSLSDIGANIGRTAQGASEDITPPGMNLGQQVATGAVSSVGQVLPAIVAGPEALVPAGIGLAAAQQAGSRYTEIRDAGFGGGRAALHAAVEGASEALGEAISLPVLAKPTLPILDRLMHFVARDLAGEEFTTTVEQASSMLSDNPNMTWGQFLDGLKMTALVTPVAAGAQVAVAHPVMSLYDGGGAAKVPDPNTTGPTGEPLDATTAPPPTPALPAPSTDGVPPPAVTPAEPATPPDGGTPATPAPSADNVPVPGGTPPRDGQPAPDSFPRQDLVDALKAAVPGLADSKTFGSGQYGVVELRHPETAIAAQVDGSGQITLQVPKTPGDKTGPVDMYVYPDLATAVQHIQQHISAAQAAVNPSLDFTQQTGYASMLDTTPQQMFTQKAFDPELYDGVHASQRGQLGVERNDDGTFTVATAGETLHYDTAQAALNDLSKWTGVDIRTDPQALSTFYGEALINRLMREPNLWQQVSPEVNSYFGGYLQKIAAATADRVPGGIGFPQGMFEGRYALSRQANPPSFGAARALQGPLLRPNNTEHITITKPADLNIVAASKGTFLRATDNSPLLRKLTALAETIRSVYTPNASVIVTLESGKERTGGMALVHPGVYTLTLKRSYVENVRSSPDSLRLISHIQKTVAHEMGHITIMERFYQAAPEVRAQLIHSYLNYTRYISQDTALMDYMLRFNTLPRLGREPVPDDATTTLGQMAQDQPSWISYLMSPSEYWADQAAAYFLYHRGAALKVEHQWYHDLVNYLQDLWTRFNSKLQLNKDFVKWLDDLAGIKDNSRTDPGKISGRGPHTAISPPPTAASIRASKASRTQITTDKQALALADKAMKLMRELHHAGATKAEVDALSPTGLIQDIKWDQAVALADSYGIPRTLYDWPMTGRSADDTSAFREQLWGFHERMADEDAKDGLAKAGKAVRGFNWFLQKTMTAVQLRKRFGDQVPGVKNFVDTLEKMFNYRSRWKEVADNRIKDMKKVPHAERARVFQALLDEDKSGTFLSTITRNVAGQRVFSMTPEAAQKYRLTEMGRQLYENIRADFDAALEELENQAAGELERLYAPGPALTKAIAELHDGFNQMRARPYVPHTRFGDHTITVREAGKVREFYQLESGRDAMALERRLRREYANQNDVAVSRGVMTDQFRQLIGLPPQLIGAMKAQLGLTPEQIGKFEDLIKDMTNGASFVRRFKRRKDIEGWEDEAELIPRAYADYMSRFANHVSRLKFNHVLTDSTSSVKGQALDDARAGVNTVELNNLSNWLGRLQEYVNNPGAEFSNMRAAATIWYLGANVKSAVVNFASVPMMTTPYLSKRFGWARTSAVMTQAMTDVARQYARMDAMSDDERKMLEALRTAGRIDQSFATALAGIREGGRLSDQTALSKPAAAFFGMKYYAMWMFQKVEVINREVTALAAYRLMRTQKDFAADDPDGFDKNAMQFASQSVQDTQNENAQWNRAEFMRHKKSVLTMFMSYNQNVIYQMFGGDASWMRMLAVQFAMAGLLGLPFAQDLDELIKWFTRKVFGSDINVEKAVRAYLKDTIVQSDWILHGASHNVFGLNLSGSLGQGQQIPGVDALAMEGSFNDRIANAAGDVGGAGFGIIMSLLKALASNDPSQIRRFSNALPQFAHSYVEGYKMLTSGQAQDPRGAALAQVSSPEAMARILGFQLTKVSQAQDVRHAQKDVVAYWLTRRAYVIALYDMAAQTGDSSWYQKAGEALREFNTEAVDGSLRITAAQLRQGLRDRAMARAKTSADIGPNRSQVETYQRVGSLYQQGQ